MSAIYEIDWKKYRNLSFDKALFHYSEFRKNLHTCPAMMERKKQLELLVKESNNKDLKRHFKTSFRKRKRSFYQKVVYEILTEEELTDLETKALELTKDILYIYSVKQEEGEALNDTVEHLTAMVDHEQEMRESMIDSWRGMDYD